MKRIFTLLVITIAVLHQQAAAQIKKGEKMLGGNIGFSNTKSEQSSSSVEAKGTNFIIGPQLGFGVGNNWVVGIQAGYQYSRQKATYGPAGYTEQKISTVSGALFARKFFPMGERFGIFGHGDVTYSHADETYRYQAGGPDGKVNTNSVMVAVSPGAYFRTGKRFILEAEIGSLGYQRSTSKPEGGGNKSTSNSVFLGLSNNLSIGFKVVL